jgi:hypothetical protein
MTLEWNPVKALDGDRKVLPLYEPPCRSCIYYHVTVEEHKDTPVVILCHASYAFKPDFSCFER